ncbi:MAG: acetate/propionate family kinase [Gammaproteobacteria bacterium]
MKKRQKGRCVLSINAGSSSVKAAFFRVGSEDNPERLAEIEASGIGEDDARIAWKIRDQRQEKQRSFDSHHDALAAVLDLLRKQELPDPDALGHRIVRSPRGQSAPARLTPELMQALEQCRALAPLHIPPELDAIEAARKHFPSAEQIACFDNHFFSTLPAVAKRLPLPRALDEAGIERIGYHGLSYEYIVSRLDGARGRTVVAHLGNGASMAAIRDGRPIDTTMGYTPAGGLMMGTRTGDLDPGALIAWMRQEKTGADELERLVNLQSGLTGVSGGESSMEALLEQAADGNSAEEAVALFCYIARKHLGAMIAALGGIDTLVFTGGIGEHAPTIRERMLEGLDDLGLALDADANAAGKPNIESQDSRAQIRVIPTDEDAVIARHAAALIAQEEKTS